MTAQDIAELEAAAQGNVTVPGTNLPTEVVQNYPGCNQNSKVAATDPSRPLDLSKFNTDQCGLMSFYVDLSSSSTTANYTLVLGGNIGTGRSQVATDIYEMNLASGGLLADVDVANVFGVNAADFNPTDIFDWLQDTFNGYHWIAQRLDVERTSGSVDLTSLGKIRKYSLSPVGDWGVCNPRLQQNFCDPCLDDNGSRVSYQGFFPVGTVEAIAIDLPTDLVATFEFCIYRYENARNMTKC